MLRDSALPQVASPAATRARCPRARWSRRGRFVGEDRDFLLREHSSSQAISAASARHYLQAPWERTSDRGQPGRDGSPAILAAGGAGGSASTASEQLLSSPGIERPRQVAEQAVVPSVVEQLECGGIAAHADPGLVSEAVPSRWSKGVAP